MHAERHLLLKNAAYHETVHPIKHRRVRWTKERPQRCREKYAVLRVGETQHLFSEPELRHACANIEGRVKRIDTSEDGLIRVLLKLIPVHSAVLAKAIREHHRLEASTFHAVITEDATLQSRCTRVCPDFSQSLFVGNDTIRTANRNKGVAPSGRRYTPGVARLNVALKSSVRINARNTKRKPPLRSATTYERTTAKQKPR